MRRYFTTVAALSAIALLGLGGCESAGLSVNEATSGPTSYTAIVYSLYDNAGSNFGANSGANYGTQAAFARPALAKPIKLAVAQLGQVAAPGTMIDELKKHAELVASVESVPSVYTENMPVSERVNEAARASEYESEQAHRQTQKMLRFAADLGADYLFLFGGDINYGSHDTDLKLLDLTLVGAFVVPSEKLVAEGHAAGCLIDVKTGRVIFAVSSDARWNSMASSVGQDDGQRKMLQSVRDDLLKKVTTDLIDKLKTTN